MTGTNTPAKVPFEVWAEFKIRQLREQAATLEGTLLQYLSVVQSGASIDNFNASPVGTVHTMIPSLPLQSVETEITGKYQPLVAAWEAAPEQGMTHAEIFSLAQRTVKDVSNENAVRTFVFSLKKLGKVEDIDGKWYIRTQKARDKVAGLSIQ